MESAIRLCYSPLPSASLHLSYGSKGTAAARPSRFHLRLSHASLSLSQFSAHFPVPRSFGHVNCMLNRFSEPSKNEESDNKILRGVTGVSLVLACVLGLFNFSSKMNPKFNTAYASSTPPSMSFKLPGGEAPLQSLLKMINAEEHSNLTPPQFHQEPDKASVDALKLYAVGLSKSGKQGEVEALKMMENEYNKYKNHPEAEHFLGMALVELLIFQGKFEEARKRLDRLIDQQLASHDHKQVTQLKNLKYEEKIAKLLSDEYKFELGIPQFLLYKAIIHTMLENKEAAKWGEAFGKKIHGN